MKKLFNNFTPIKNYFFELLISFLIISATILSINMLPNHTILIVITGFMLLISIHYFWVIQITSHINNINEKIRKSNLSQKSHINNLSPFHFLDTQMSILIKNLEKEILDVSQLTKVKSEFLSNVSHEFKTPIFTITGLVDTLIDGAINDENVNKKFLRKIKRQTNRLENLFSDLIMITKLESDSIVLEKKSVKLDDIFNWIIDNYKEKAESKGLGLIVPLNSNIVINGNEEGLKSVFSNLTDNAINYSNSGDIIWSAKNISDEIKIKVIDNGIGINLEDQSKIFERFYRVNKDRSRKTGGSGLGLAIVKHVLLSHYTEIDIQSEPDKGTVFCFNLQPAKS